jgi:hypothetical protein
MQTCRSLRCTVGPVLRLSTILSLTPVSGQRLGQARLVSNTGPELGLPQSAQSTAMPATAPESLSRMPYSSGMPVLRRPAK